MTYTPFPPGHIASAVKSEAEVRLLAKIARERVPQDAPLTPAARAEAEWDKTIAIKCSRYELEHPEDVGELRAKARAAVVPFGKPFPEPGTWGALIVEARVQKAIIALHPAWPSRANFVRSRL